MGKQVRILIADDQPRSRSGLRALLAMWPTMDVIGEAIDGQQAVDLAASNGPDVILMDMRMPVMDGIAATRRIKTQQPQVRVVALSMYGEYVDAALAAGADAFLVKGCSAENLFAAIQGDY